MLSSGGSKWILAAVQRASVCLVNYIVGYHLFFTSINVSRGDINSTALNETNNKSGGIFRKMPLE